MSDQDDLDPIDEELLERALSEALTSEASDPVAYGDLVSYIQGTADAELTARIQGLLADSADLRERVVLLSETMEHLGQAGVGLLRAQPAFEARRAGMASRSSAHPAWYSRAALGIAASFFLGAVLAVGGYRLLLTTQGTGLPSPSNGPAIEAIAVAPAIRELKGGRVLRGMRQGERLEPGTLEVARLERSVLLVLRADLDDTYKNASLRVTISESGAPLWSTTRPVRDMVSNGDVVLLVDTRGLRDGQEYTVTVRCVDPGSALDGTELFSRSFRILRK